MLIIPPLFPATLAPTLPATPATSLTLWVSLVSRSVSLVSTPLAASTVRVTFSEVVPLSATATGISLVPVTVMMKVLSALTAVWSSVTFQVMVTSRGWPSARYW